MIQQYRQLALVGGGHAHLATIHAIADLKAAGIAVTVIDPVPQLHYSGMMPAVLGGWVAPRAALIPTRDMVTAAGGTFRQERVTRIAPDRSASGPLYVETEQGQFRADRVSIAAGSRVGLLPGCPDHECADRRSGPPMASPPGCPEPGGGTGTSGSRAAGSSAAIADREDSAGSRLPVCVGAKPISGILRLAELVDRFTNRDTTVSMMETPETATGPLARVVKAWAAGLGPLRIVVVGGGPSGVELAGNLARRLGRGSPGNAGGSPGNAGGKLQPVEIRIVTRASGVLASMPERAGAAAERSLTRLGVELVRERSACRVEPGGLILDDGRRLSAEIVVVATGLKPPVLVGGSEALPAEDGFLQVDNELRAGELPLLGGGDSVRIQGRRLARIGVHAIRQNSVLLHNIRSGFGLEDDLISYDAPDHPLLIINPGDGTGIAVRGKRVIHNRAMFALKLRIDWAFVRSRGRRTRPALFRPPRHGK